MRTRLDKVACAIVERWRHAWRHQEYSSFLMTRDESRYLTVALFFLLLGQLRHRFQALDKAPTAKRLSTYKRLSTHSPRSHS
jgi:hypothetical protein